jgi:hypothetical protein
MTKQFTQYEIVSNGILKITVIYQAVGYLSIENKRTKIAFSRKN